MIEITRKRPDTEAPILERVANLESLCFKICEVMEANIMNLETADSNLKEQIAKLSSAVTTLSGQVESLAGSLEV